MANMEWTDEQWSAITARGGALLVSAAAGSGKTAVLVQRVIERITDPDHPADADRLLIVTFTRAAAAEMKARIQAALSGKIAQNPMNPALQRQQLLLQNAHISTIHSFCSDLVRENFYRLDLSPDYKIADSSDLALMQEAAMADVLELLYVQKDPGFLLLCELMPAKRGDHALAGVITRLYEFVRSHPFPKRWMEDMAAFYNPGTEITCTAWGQAVLGYAEDALEYGVRILSDFKKVLASDDALFTAYGPVLSSARHFLQSVLQLVENEEWDKAASALQSFAFDRAAARLKKGEYSVSLRAQVDVVREEVKGIIKRLQALFSSTQAECAEDLAVLFPAVKALFDAVLRFEERFSVLKARRGVLDFGDLEHFALKLLIRLEDGRPVRTPEAVAYAKRFDEVLIDEYQDTNEAQDMIFWAVSQDESNLFMVGDVKQSIYRFRQAMPELFLEKRALFSAFDGEHYPAKILLSRNFRSRSGVTDAVNFVFGQLMSTTLGEMEYTGEELVCGADYPALEKADMELHLLDASGLEEEDTRDLAEARYIAGLVRTMMDDGLTVTEKGVQRPARFRDFCILLRSKQSHAPAYAEEFALQGIPAWTDTSTGFLGAAEVGYLLSLLRVLDNPVQDIPLAATLRSPSFAFAPDDLADIRLAWPDKPLYFALQRRARSNEKCREFLDVLRHFRRLSAVCTVRELLLRIYDEVGYPAMVQAMPGGELRHANLRLLLTYAGKFESAGYKGLSGFMRFIDRLEQRGADISQAATLSESADVVRIMTIHSAKGLEFPVCILAGCATQFNRTDINASVLLHSRLGIGMKRRMEDGRRFSTLPREAVALELERGFLSEEMRVLYVAMTRAKERLLAVCTAKNPAGILQKAAASLPEEGLSLNPYGLRGAKSFAEWLLACALRHPAAKMLRETANTIRITPIPTESRWKFVLTEVPAPVPSSGSEQIQTEAACVDEALLGEIAARLQWKYPYSALAAIPAKMAASELAKGSADTAIAAARPAFMRVEGLSPAERGTAMHAFMQHCSFQHASQDPEAEAARLYSIGFLTKEQAGAIDPARVRLFFEHPFVRRIESARQIWRELRFTVGIPPIMLDDSVPPGPEEVVLQGIADLVFEEQGRLVVLDYKTDFVRDTRELADRYAKQLFLYASAMEKVLRCPVKEKVIYSFHQNEFIILP